MCDENPTHRKERDVWGTRLERRADMYVSTLQDFVRAMGGELKITAKFPEGSVEIRQFEDTKKAAAGKQ